MRSMCAHIYNYIYLGCAISSDYTGNGKVLCIRRNNHKRRNCISYFQYSCVMLAWSVCVGQSHTRAVHSPCNSIKIIVYIEEYSQ